MPQEAHELGESRRNRLALYRPVTRGLTIERLAQHDRLRQRRQQRAGGRIQTHDRAIGVGNHESFAQAGEDGFELRRASRHLGQRAIAPAPCLNYPCGGRGQFLKQTKVARLIHVRRVTLDRDDTQHLIRSRPNNRHRNR